jgi:mevalonate kinase
LALIARSMKRAQECFATWQLIPGDAYRLAQDLERQGALAVKITGAGGGGFLVALWNS